MAAGDADAWQRFRRFLVLGSEAACYSAGDTQAYKRASVPSLRALIRGGKGCDAVAEIQRYVAENRMVRYVDQCDGKVKSCPH
jgi:hypothetical protein